MSQCSIILHQQMEVTIIRKVKLSMNEQKKYEIIKSLADHPAANKQRAALTLGLYCTSYQSYAERLQRTWKGIFYSWQQRT